MKVTPRLFEQFSEQIIRFSFVVLSLCVITISVKAQCAERQVSNSSGLIPAPEIGCNASPETVTLSSVFQVGGQSPPNPVTVTFSGGIVSTNSVPDLAMTTIGTDNPSAVGGCLANFTPIITVQFSRPVRGLQMFSNSPGLPAVDNSGNITLPVPSGLSYTYEFANPNITSVTFGDTPLGTCSNFGVTYGCWDYAISLTTLFFPNDPVTPTAGTVVTSPAFASVGTTVNVTGSNWTATTSGAYKLLFDGNLVAQQSPLNSCADQPNLSFDIPCGTTVGNHTITVQLINSSSQVLVSQQTSFAVSSPTLAKGEVKGANIISCPSVRVDALEVSMPITPNPNAKGKEPEPATFTSTNNSTQFADAESPDLMVVFQATKIGLPEIKAKGVPSSDAHLLRWELRRNNIDNIPSGASQLPDLNKNRGDQVRMTPNTPGSFILVCYVDNDKNDAFDEGEQLRVLRFAIIRVTVRGMPLVYAGDPNDRIGQTGEVGCGLVGTDCVKTLGPSMILNTEILLEGGGQDRSIGVSKVVLGAIGNLITDDHQSNYPVPSPTPPSPGNTVGIGKENPGDKLPMVDTGNVNLGKEPTGGSEAFRTSSIMRVVSNPGTLGTIVTVESDDPPGFGYWKTIHPITTNRWETTQGGFKFKEFVVGYTESFIKYYGVMTSAVWTTTGIGRRDSSTGLWVNNGSQITVQDKAPNITSTAMTIHASNGSPLPGVEATLQSLGLSFVIQHMFEYSTVK